MNEVDLQTEITKVASELYEKSGRVEGHDLDNWLEAEKIVMSQYKEQEKREYERRPFVRVIKYSPLHHPEELTEIFFEGVTVDVSKIGLGMITDYPLKNGDILFFEPEINVDDSKVMVSTVKWASEIEKEIYRVGLKIYPK